MGAVAATCTLAALLSSSAGCSARSSPPALPGGGLTSGLGAPRVPPRKEAVCRVFYPFARLRCSFLR